MYCKIRLRAGIFYGTILAGIIFTVFVFVFSPKGFTALDSKKELIKIRKEKITELNRQKISLSNNIERLKSDKEYIISYAKTFGYLDSSKNEKIIKIIKDEEVKDFSESPIKNQKYSSNQNENINIKRIFVLSLMMILSLFFIVYFNRQKYSSNQNTTNQNAGNG